MMMMMIDVDPKWISVFCFQISLILTYTFVQFVTWVVFDICFER